MAVGVEMVSKVPVVVFTRERLRPGTEAWAQACKEIVNSLEDHGCFIAECEEDLPQELHDSVFKVTEQLFDLPHESKIKNTNFKPSHGYIPKNPGTPLLEGMNIDGAEKLDECQKFTSLMWPSGNDTFCKTVNAYSTLIAEVEKVVMKMMCETYGVEHFYDRYMESTTYLLRFLKYKKPQGIEQSVNPIAHTDKSFLSYLHQNNVRGLEVQTKEGEWFTFEPSPTTFMVMAGDACVAWSNGKIKACYHRVAVREETEVRYSLGVFSYQTGMIETPKEFIDEQRPQQYKPFNHVDFLCFYDSSDNRIKAASLIQAYCGVN